jgi:hypothetical protein
MVEGPDLGVKDTVMKEFLHYTDKKSNKFSLPIRKFRCMGSGAKSYMRKGCLIYEAMRKYLTIYEGGR